MMGPIFVYLATYGGAAVALFRPFVGLLVYIGFAVLKPEFVWHWSVRPGNYSRTVAVASLVGWAFNGFGRWDLGRGKAVIAALIGYFAWIVVCALQAPDQARAWEYVDKYSKIVLPVLVGITTINSVRQLKLLAWVILLSQAYPALELNRMYFAGYNALREEGFASMDNNSYAISLVTCTGLAGFLFWHSEKWWQKALALASGALLVHAVLFSFSRGGMLGLIVLAVVAFAVMPKGPKELGAFGLAILIGLAFAGAQVRERFASTFAGKDERDASAGGRLELWAACGDCILKHPVFGVGPGHMPLAIVEYGFSKGKESHTLWLQVGAELGVPGMLLLASYYGICIARLLPIARGRWPSADPWLVYLARAVVAALCGFAVSAQFVSLTFLETPYYVALVGAGVLKLASAPSRSTAGEEGPEPGSAGPGWPGPRGRVDDHTPAT